MQNIWVCCYSLGEQGKNLVGKAKVLSKVAGWKVKVLSHAGRTMLIRAVDTAMPLFCMSTFMLPKGWSEEID